MSCLAFSKGGSYDNALAETVNGLYKAELINPNGPWRSVEQVELATAFWVDFWNTRRRHYAPATHSVIRPRIGHPVSAGCRWPRWSRVAWRMPCNRPSR